MFGLYHMIFTRLIPEVVKYILMKDDGSLDYLISITARDINCHKLIQDLYNFGVSTIVYAVVPSKSEMERLNTLDLAKNYCYENCFSLTLSNLLSTLERTGVVKIVDCKFNFVEYFSNYECYLQVESLDKNIITEIMIGYASLNFANKFGFDKQVQVLEKALKKLYSELENPEIYYVHKLSDYDAQYYDPILGLEKLKNRNYLDFHLTKFDLGFEEDHSAPGSPEYVNSYGYECTAQVNLLPKLIHKWQVEEGLFSDRLKYDTKTGYTWVGDDNYLLFRNQQYASRVMKMWEILVKHVNCFTSYLEIAKYVYEWNSDQAKENYVTSKKDKVRRDLQDIKKQLEKAIADNELSNILSIETKNGYRLNFCLS